MLLISHFSFFFSFFLSFFFFLYLADLAVHEDERVVDGLELEVAANVGRDEQAHQAAARVAHLGHQVQAVVARLGLHLGPRIGRQARPPLPARGRVARVRAAAPARVARAAAVVAPQRHRLGRHHLVVEAHRAAPRHGRHKASRRRLCR